MLRWFMIVVAAVFATTIAPARQSSGYHVVRRYPLGGDGGWDYLLLDPLSRRLYVSRGTRVVVIDADSGVPRGEIANTPGVHGVAVAPDLGRGATSNGRDQAVTIFDLQSLKPLGRVRTTGGNPDAIVYEPATHRVFTFNGTGQNATAIDLMAGAVAGTVALGGKPEFAVRPGRRPDLREHREHRRAGGARCPPPRRCGSLAARALRGAHRPLA